MSQERLGPHFGFPRIENIHCEEAIRNSNIPFFNRVRFINAQMNGPMRKYDRFLRDFLNSEARDLSQVSSRDNVVDFLFGAAAMHHLFAELNKLGYKFPPVSEDIIKAFQDEKQQLIDDVTNRLSDKPVEMTEDVDYVSSVFSEAEADSETVILKTEQIYEENPTLIISFFEPLPPVSQGGARQVYALKRRQYLSDQLSGFFNQ